MRPKSTFSRCALTALLHLLIAVTNALNPPDPLAKGAYFISTDTTHPGQSYVFALNIVPSTGDIFFHMSAHASINSSIPAFSWMGIGFGSAMRDTLMLIAYPSANGTGVAVSARVGRGHSEPEWAGEGDGGKVVEKVWGDAYAPNANSVSKGIMIAHAVCRNCTAWAGGALDLESKAQPFIYALGADPGKGEQLRSDELDARLRRHAFYGHFLADMTVAQSSEEHARVPSPNDPGASPSGVADTNFAYHFAWMPFDTRHDTDWAPVLHGVLMCLAFVLVFPLGALLLRLVKRVGVVVHVGLQMFALVFVIIGFAGGVYASLEYNQSRHFGTAHQVLGLLLFVTVFVQAGLGASHHSIYVRTKRTTILGFIHRFLGPSIIVLGIINVGLGLNLAGNRHYTTRYGIVAAVLSAIMVAVFVLNRFYWKPRQYKPEFHTRVWPNMDGGYDASGTALLTTETPVSAYELSPWKESDQSGRIEVS